MGHCTLKIICRETRAGAHMQRYSSIANLHPRKCITCGWMSAFDWSTSVLYAPLQSCRPLWNLPMSLKAIFMNSQMLPFLYFHRLNIPPAEVRRWIQFSGMICESLILLDFLYLLTNCDFCNLPVRLWQKVLMTLFWLQVMTDRLQPPWVGWAVWDSALLKCHTSHFARWGLFS